jgi:nucleoside 2-deoxyribosyltransferase
MSKLVYLAGPITGTSFEDATNWRTQASVALAEEGIITLSPMRGKDYLAQHTSLADSYDNVNVLSTQKGIVTRDRWDCQRANVVLVNMLGAERVSIGTVIELGWADAARNPIVLIMESENIHDHAMVRELAGFIVPTIDEGLLVVKALCKTS